MKKIILIILSSIFLSIVINYGQHVSKAENQTEKKEKEIAKKIEKSNKIPEKDVRENVWNQFTSNDKARIKGSWEDAVVRNKIILRKEIGVILDDTFVGQEVYVIDYPSNDNPTIGGVIVYADINSHRLIGYGYRD